jgi:hypothetical protein
MRHRGKARPNRRNGRTDSLEKGGFSVYGMTSIFTGALYPVIGMGAALELGKLSAVALLGHRHGSASWGLKLSLTVLVTVLMALNAIGCFGYLSRAHIASALAGAPCARS